MAPKRPFSADANETEIILDNKKRVTVRRFKNINLVDIREYWTDAKGKRNPSQKGISLTEDTYIELIKAHNKIQNALDKLNSGDNDAGASNKKKPKIDIGKVNEKKSEKEDGKEAQAGSEAAAENAGED
ncbi:hypothetical protein PVL30_004039 [Lodderomyces elongisporus]|uniref:Transcriptional coactivator p15 (PC4) C-terminal domain-containing protein n=1 Tax=Lodderomyces elongisporus (strain ATCC 11503 / CBS 2605 / JCM 1781 / NBRC 1676 / NRRL YB-4239) TaxID=379508 RepID=A5E3X6_LODEL|nr:uncharacterized protein PVL30_004039 [Lodderomyces elongisporus]EDK46134.1 hypothetical protein LELG_04314 [Lodderomyces elongisporus NRRL YB-4239]WLF80263.1 hypothetical protein PVL30_004039 [Lodderomyces elongisporus]